MHVKRVLILFVTLVLAVAPAADAQKRGAKKRAPALSPAVAKEIQGLEDKELSRRLEAAFNLGSMGATAAPAVPALVAVLGKSDGGIYAVPREAMKYFDEDTLVLQGNDGSISMFSPLQTVAASALARIGKPATEPLRKALLDGDAEGEGYYAGRALAKMGDASATAILYALLRDASAVASRRKNAAYALGYSRDPASIDALIEALGDAEPDVRKAAAQSLERVTKQEFGEDAGKWKAWRASQAGESR